MAQPSGDFDCGENMHVRSSSPHVGKCDIVLACVRLNPTFCTFCTPRVVTFCTQRVVLFASPPRDQVRVYPKSSTLRRQKWSTLSDGGSHDGRAGGRTER